MSIDTRVDNPSIVRANSLLHEWELRERAAKDARDRAEIDYALALRDDRKEGDYTPTSDYEEKFERSLRKHEGITRSVGMARVALRNMDKY